MNAYFAEASFLFTWTPKGPLFCGFVPFFSGSKAINMWGSRYGLEGKAENSHHSCGESRILKASHP